MRLSSRAEGAKQLIRYLREASYDGWLVGGCVRDQLCGLIPKDYDLATTSDCDQNINILTARGLRVYPTGRAYGTVTVVFAGHHYELTTLRQDAQCDGRRAQVVFGGTLATDAMRRDFTINALYQTVEGKICDYVGGRKDIRRRIMCFVGRPEDRIREDYLRILRFFRLAHRLGFQCDPGALEAISTQVSGLALLSKERVYAEIMSLIRDMADESVTQTDGIAYLTRSDLFCRRHQIMKLMMDCGVLDACGWPSSEPPVELWYFAAIIGSSKWHLPMISALTWMCCDLQPFPSSSPGQWYRLYKSSALDRRCFELWHELMSHWTQWLKAEDYPNQLFQWIQRAQDLYESNRESGVSWLEWVDECLSAVHVFRKRFSSTGHRLFHVLTGVEYAMTVENHFGDLRMTCYLETQQIIDRFDLKPSKALGELIEDLRLATWQQKVVSESQAQQFVSDWIARHGFK